MNDAMKHLSSAEPQFRAIHSRAPARIDLAGGWTDVPPFAEREGGAVVNLAITRYTTALLQTGGVAGVRLRSTDYDLAIDAPDVAALRYDGNLDLLKAALRRMHVSEPLMLTTRADVPPGSGLGTSAMTAIAITGAIDAMQGGRRSRDDLAALATSLEIDELGIHGGKQDQLAAVLGGVNYLTFGQHAPMHQRLALAPETVAQIETRLVLCYSGVSRVSGGIIKRVQQRYEANDPATVGALRGLRSIANALRDALMAGNIEELGPLLHANWEAQCALHPSVTNEDVEALFAIARRNGALSGKACGAGGGGCIAFFASADADQNLRDALALAGGTIIDWRLDTEGLQTQFVDAADEQSHPHINRG